MIDKGYKSLYLDVVNLVFSSIYVLIFDFAFQDHVRFMAMMVEFWLVDQ